MNKNHEYSTEKKSQCFQFNKTAMLTAVIFSAAIIVTPVFAEVDKKKYSPYANVDYPNLVLFGDSHVHTKYSPDAGMTGTTLGPDESYRFAKGETVISNTGIPVRLKRALDWLVITDHAENLGLPVAILEQDKSLMANKWGREMAGLFAKGTVESARAGLDMYQQVLNTGNDPLKETTFGKDSWNDIMDTAERHNIPGSFSAFIGFEWTSAPNGNNLHRNIIFKEGKGYAEKIYPISAYDTENPEDVWQWMADYEKKTGGHLLAIAHNGNISNGTMFDDTTFNGKPLSAEYAKARNRFEPVYEVTQTKGDGETHPFLSPEDQFADFETWDAGSFGPVPKSNDMLQREYARETYKRGLAYQAKLGENPFKFGMVGSTDTHTGLSTVEENNFFGKVAPLEPSADPIRFEEPVLGRLAGEGGKKVRAWQANAAGLAAVWAHENTRAAIFDALKRKEVYATTGSRMTVRVFGGWGYNTSDLTSSNFIASGYDNGVPMGGDLTAAPKGTAPKLMVKAMRDPDGANLDRIQVIKGWLDAKGKTHEQVYDIACGGSSRKIQGSDSCNNVGNTVDVKNTTYDNSIGSAALEAFWEDPSFDASQSAFYYVRVLEIPTPRWTAYDAKFFGKKLKDKDSGFIQERAYSSPIWYTP